MCVGCDPESYTWPDTSCCSFHRVSHIDFDDAQPLTTVKMVKAEEDDTDW